MSADSSQLASLTDRDVRQLARRIAQLPKVAPGTARKAQIATLIREVRDYRAPLTRTQKIEAVSWKLRSWSPRDDSPEARRWLDLAAAIVRCPRPPFDARLVRRLADSGWVRFARNGFAWLQYGWELQPGEQVVVESLKGRGDLNCHYPSLL